MMLAAIFFAAGVAVEFCAVLFAPLGYQDEKGFHVVAESAGDPARRLVENPS